MKKLVALLLAMIMLLSLVACGSAGSNGEAEQLDYDPDAKWAGIYTDPQWDGTLPLVQEGEDNVITWGMAASTNVIDYDTNKFTLWLEEQTGVDIQFVTLASSASDAVTQVNLMIAGGEELPDIVSVTSMSAAQIREYGRDGVFLNTSGYMATDAYYTRQALEKHHGDNYPAAEERIRTVMLDPGTEAIYGFPMSYKNSMDVLGAHMWINQTWLDNLGLTAPTNVEELYNVLVAFRDQDPNGNGIKDEIPFFGRDGSQATDSIGWVINAFLYYNAAHPYIVEDGVVSTPFDQPEYREALIYIKKLVDEGLLSPSSWTASSPERRAIHNPTDGIFKAGIISASYDGGFQYENESIYQYVPLAPLADETGRGGYGPRRANKVQQGVQITEDCDNPRMVFRFLDFMSSDECYLRGRWGVLGEDWDYVDENNTLPGALGGEARIIQRGPDPTTKVNNQTWGGSQSQISRDYWQFALDLSDGSWTSTQYLKAQQHMANYDAAGQPEQIFYDMMRTDEEEVIFSDYNADLVDFVKRSRAEFCNGLQDPADDAQWQKYLDNLYGLHYQEAWIDLAQASWDRQQAYLNGN